MRHILPRLRWLEIFVAIAGVAIASATLGPHLYLDNHHGIEGLVINAAVALSIFLLMSFMSFYMVHNRPLPSMLTDMALGFFGWQLILPILKSPEWLTIVTSLIANCILFGGGLETSFKDFRRLFLKIFLLAVPGVIVSAIMLSFAVQWLGLALGLTVSITVAVLLGGILASTDPAAIIPVTKNVDPDARGVSIAESALNDVVGTVIVKQMILVLTGGLLFTSILTGGYQHLVSLDSLAILGREALFGTLAGIIGFLLLRYLAFHKREHGFENGPDSAFLVFVPLSVFAAAMRFGGSGFLGSFLAGLFFTPPKSLNRTTHFFDEYLINGFARSAIFILLGGLARLEIDSLLQYAPVGIPVALVFMLIIRPLMVIPVYALTAFLTRKPMNWREALFLSWVRETGVIPAVLLIILRASGIPGTEAATPIGIWVILLTIGIQPLTTSWWARKVGVIRVNPPAPATHAVV